MRSRKRKQLDVSNLLILILPEFVSPYVKIKIMPLRIAIRSK
jgi:hypothetical protein